MSGGKKQKTESKTTGWQPAMQGIEQNVLPGVNQYAQDYGQGEGLWSGSQLGQEDQWVRQGQNAQMLQGQQFGSQIDNAINSLEGFIDYDPNSVQNMAQREALGNNISAQFNNSIRPGIEDRGTGAGQFGGNQQSLAMGAATQPLGRAIADSESQMMNADKNRGLQATGMLPGMAQQQFVPGAMMEQFGNQRTQRGQLDQMDMIQQYEAERNNRLRSQAELQGLYTPLAGLEQTTTGTTSGGGGGLLQSAAGLGSMALGSYLGGGGSLGSLFGGGGAAAGGGLSSAASSGNFMPQLDTSGLYQQ